MARTSTERSRILRKRRDEDTIVCPFEVRDRLIDELIRNRWIGEGDRENRRLIGWALRHQRIVIRPKPDDLEVPEL